MDIHQKFIKQTFKLAEKGQGKTSPNPIVGALIVRNNQIISSGFHRKSGSFHAEIEAIKKAKGKTKNTSLYVSLEPCAHYGKTPPCVEAIVKANIKQVYIAMEDPNPKVKGKGIKYLNDHGVKTYCSILENEAKKINEFYIKYISSGKPFVILKAAISLDGKIATATYDSFWLSNEKSRKYVHKLRSIVDAVLVGINTVIKDNPKLTCRLKSPTSRNPYRIILDSFARINLNANVLIEPHEVILATTHLASFRKIKKLEKRGIKVLVFKEDRINLFKLLEELANLEIGSILIEGGSKIYTSFLENKLVDKIFFFITPKLIGGLKAKSIFEGKGILKINDAIRIKDIKIKKFDDDILIEGYPSYKQT